MDISTIFDVFWLRVALSRTFLLIFQRILVSRPFLANISTYFSTHFGLETLSRNISTYFSTHFGFEILSRGHFSLFSSMFRPRQPFSWIVHAIFQHVLSQRSFLTDSSPYFPPCFGLDNPSQFDLLFSALCLQTPSHGPFYLLPLSFVHEIPSFVSWITFTESCP